MNFALFLDRPGPGFALRAGVAETPPPGPGEVRLRVQACGLNPVDAKLASAGHPAWRLPHILGLDVCGVVETLGPGVERLSAGDRVMGHLDLRRAGGLAAFTTAKATTLTRLPAGIDDLVAASLPCAALTAYQALVRRLRLMPGMTLLVEAAAGGVGGFAVQLGKHLGLTVIATASAANRAYVEGLGADAVIDHRSEDVAGRVRELTGGRGLDAVLDSLGGAAATRDLGLLAHGGQMASLLGLPERGQVDVFARAPTVAVIALGAAHGSGDPAAEADLAQMGDEMVGLLLSGAIRPLPIRSLAPDPATVAEALRAQNAGQVSGKQVVDLRNLQTGAG